MNRLTGLFVGLALALASSAASAQTWHRIPNETGKITAAGRFNGQIYYVWVGSDSGQTINVGSLSGSKTTLWGESGIGGMALAAFRDKLYLAWVGTNQQLNLISSADGVNFSNKVTLSEYSGTGVAMASSESYLHLAWTGTDFDTSINSLRSSDGVNWDNKRGLTRSYPETPPVPTPVYAPEGSDYAPSLTYGGGKLYLAWVNRTLSEAYYPLQVQSVSSTDGVQWSSVSRYNQAWGAQLTRSSPAGWYDGAFTMVYTEATDTTCSAKVNGPGVPFQVGSTVLDVCYKAPCLNHECPGASIWFPVYDSASRSLFLFYNNDNGYLEYYDFGAGSAI